MKAKSLGCALIVFAGLLALTGCAGDPAQCTAEYAAHADAIRASGQTREAFLASCVGGTENDRYLRMDVPAANPTPATSGQTW